MSIVKIGSLDVIRLAMYIGDKRLNPAARIGDRLICAYSDSIYSHIELVMDHHDWRRALCGSASQRDGCVRVKQIDLTSGRWEVFAFLATERAVKLAHRKIREADGMPYDYVGLSSFLLPGFAGIDRSVVSKSKTWCSRIIGEALGAPDPVSMTPVDALYFATESFDTKWKESLV